MAHKWIVHIKKTMKTMKSKGTYKKGLGLKQVIKEAKKSWHHAKKGGADEGMPVSSEEEETGLTAGRRKRHGKTRRHRKH
jgi:hypothetical protein